MMLRQWQKLRNTLHNYYTVIRYHFIHPASLRGTLRSHYTDIVQRLRRSYVIIITQTLCTHYTKIKQPEALRKLYTVVTQELRCHYTKLRCHYADPGIMQSLRR